MEEWKRINEYFEVSTYGNVRDIYGKYRLLTKARNGYLVVNLNELGVVSVHRLVASAFIPNPDNKRTVNHIDGDKTNNYVNNLEWATYSENNLHSWRVLDSSARKEKLKARKNEYFGRNHIVTDDMRNKMSLAKKKRVICIETGKIYDCALSASYEMPVGKQMITHACNGRAPTAGGYHWKYLDK